MYNFIDKIFNLSFNVDVESLVRFKILFKILPGLIGKNVLRDYPDLLETLQNCFNPPVDSFKTILGLIQPFSDVSRVRS